MTHPVYDQLLSEITDDLERRVLEVFLERPGERITRQDLVFRVFGHYIQKSELAASTEDRKIRECIERLRAAWPIVSSSGEAGYILEDDEERIRAFAAEQASRAENIRKSIQRAHSWLPRARRIREARRLAQPASQPGLF